MMSISIIIPIHNRAEFFHRLFNGLQSISRHDVEIVFVDNNSDDTTRLSLDKYVADLVRHTNLLVTIIEEKKLGACAARNAGLRYAKGEYIYFFDSDDEFSAQMLDDAYNSAINNESDVVALKTNIVLPTGKLLRKKMVRDSSPVYQVLVNNFATQSLFLKRDFALNNAVWDEQLFYWNDLEWGFRIMLSSPKISWLKDSYHRIYIHSNSITGQCFSQRVEKVNECHCAMRQDILALCNESQQRLLLQSLNCRIAIYAGHVCREGNADGADIILSAIDEHVATSQHKLMLKMLYWLSKHGIPSLWRLAIIFCGCRNRKAL